MSSPTRILINGAGIAGPALATLLLRSSRTYAITIIERASALRTGGQQIDLRAQGISVMRRMGLLDTIRTHCVRETGIAFVDRAGRHRAVLGVNDSGRGAQALTSEFEIMRGDMVGVLYRESLRAADDAAAVARQKKRDVDQHAAAAALATDEAMLKYEFGKHATDIAQRNGSGEVHVTFSDGSDGAFDLVVGADGQGSRTRRLAFGEEASKAAFRSLEVFNAFFTIPLDLAVEGDRHIAKIYHTSGRRTLSTRTGDRTVTQAALSTMQPSPELRDAMRRTRDAAGLEEEKAAWTKLFSDAGWQADRLLEGMRTTGDFYSFVSGQVKMDKWHKGRVVLLGDAGYCPSPNTGMGTTCALVGSYILAGELVKHGGNIDSAPERYEEVARPFIDEAQTLPPGMPRWWFRDTEFGVGTLHLLLATITRLKIDKLLFRLMPESKGGLELPYYPELSTKEVEETKPVT